MSFASELMNLSTNANVDNTSDAKRLTLKEKKELALKKKEEFIEKKRVRRDEVMTFLTQKYLKSTRESIIRAAKKGINEKYINFARDDFKANFPGLGTPKEFQSDWLTEMCNPESKYFNGDEELKKMCLDGIKFDIWNNSSFTTHFTWNE